MLLLLALALIALAAKRTGKQMVTATSSQSADRARQIGGAGTPAANQPTEVQAPSASAESTSREPGEAPGAYAKAYAELTESTISMLAGVDTPESAQRFVDQVAQQIQNLSAKVPEFYAGEFINAFKDHVVDRARVEIADCELVVSAAHAEADAVTAELNKRLDTARAAGDRAAEHSVWREREDRRAACQSKIDAAARRTELVGLRIDTCKNLASDLGFPFD